MVKHMLKYMWNIEKNCIQNVVKHLINLNAIIIIIILKLSIRYFNGFV